jgi:hypothetical protein
MRKTKILIAMIICALLVSVFSVVSFASAEDQSTATDAKNSGGEVADPPTVDVQMPDDSAADTPATDASSSEGEAVENIFELLFEDVKMHAGEIFSALALIASLILAYCYKCGLLPIVQNALNAISGILTGIEKGADENSKASSEAIGALRSRIECAEGMLDRLSENVTLVSEDLKARTNAVLGAEETRLILSAQVDMLYDIFMTSALPQYQKDAVGERIAAMRGALGKNDNEQTD